MAGQVFQGAESFLGHSTGSSGGSFLEKWKDDGEVEIVLHPRAPIGAVWNHRWFRVGEDKDKKPKIMMTRFNSMEDSVILRDQHFRYEDGTRKKPPKLCPFSLTLEWVREAIENGDIDWCDEIFRFESKSEDQEILAGGFVGLFKRDGLTDEQLDELKKAKVVLKMAFKQKSLASLDYIFAVVKLDSPDDGCVIARENKTLGKKMQKAIRDETRKWEATQPGKGDPFKTPYAFRWSFFEDESFENMYDVVALPTEATPIPDAVLAVLEEDPPDIQEQLEASNVALLRASFEKHWVHRVVPPWDDLFEKAEKFVKGTKAAEAPTDFNHGANVKTEKAPAPVVKPRASEPKAPEPKVEEFEYECDKCQAGMHADMRECPKCHAKYDDEGNSLPDPPPPAKEEPKRRSRSEAKAETKSAPAEEPKSDPAPAVETESPRRRRGG